MTGLKTDPALLAALKQAVTLRLSPAELERQRISSVMAALSDNNKMTRDEVKDMLKKM